ncbi:MAG: peptide chain release factor 1 [Candidatus Omnitrophota bacterium]|jgi:peptide chain release factor 1|nr:MAG: peptide chain release factor 1 [Candidatus Omnitrophota bacterium]
MAEKLDLSKYQAFEKRYSELEHLLASQEVIADKEQYSRLAKELSSISNKVSLFREYEKTARNIDELKAMLSAKHDKEFIELANSELHELKEKKQQLEKSLIEALKARDEESGKDVIVEIRQGTGGMEAGLFAADLFRMYSKYALTKNWAVEVMSSHPTELGGFKEIVFAIKGKDVFKHMRFESGVHRVQRVPHTEAQGRIHTSTATVAVLVEPEDVELVIDPKDLRIDTYRSSGPGGQHMQKSDSAVRITHIPTGMVVACQDERSQLKNKTKAMRILRARLLEVKRETEFKKVSEERKSQIGSGDRSEKIRTYNFPDRRVTDHRINFTSHRLESVLEGDMDELISAIIKANEDKLNERS